MRKLFSFLVASLDGFYAGPNDEFDWPNVDEEFNEFSIRQLNDIDTLLFGRVTYEGMATFWPSDFALQTNPVIAERMNSVDKVVFSDKLEKADWANSRLVKNDDLEGEISKLKDLPGKDLAIFGSPTMTASLTEKRLVDELRVMVHPVALGDGKSLFGAINNRLRFRLLQSTTFGSGNVLLNYRPEPARSE